MYRLPEAAAQPSVAWCRRGLVALLALLLVASSLGARSAPEDTQPSETAESFAAWLQEVEHLLSENEREAFAQLTRDYQRRLFIGRFWQVRDPFPETPENEFRDTWERRVELARERFGSLDGARAQALLLVGPPDRWLVSVCPQLLRPMEIWLYATSPRTPRGFSLVFLRQAPGYRIWSPLEGLQTLFDLVARPSVSRTATIERLQRECGGAEDVASALFAAIDSQTLTDQLALVPRPSQEWVDAFLGRLTEVPVGADTFEAEVKYHFPSGSDHGAAPAGRIARGWRSHHVQLQRRRRGSAGRRPVRPLPLPLRPGGVGGRRRVPAAGRAAPSPPG
jgi:GWxTD domain-containing protein